VGFLGMCGHGTIGLVASLAYLNRIRPGEHRIETPVGTVSAVLHENGEVTVNNVASFRKAARVTVEVNGFGAVEGDVAWGGNWFFLVEHSPIEISSKRIHELTLFTKAIKQALALRGITGDAGHEVDHIELFGKSSRPNLNSKNFVLCPGDAFDRSPCGTGTSAKLACMYADGKFQEGDIWRQESIVGSVFEGRIRVIDGQVYPAIRGSAYVNAEAELILDPDDPFCAGIRI
jgi:4-hydroxyproline epimerase